MKQIALFLFAFLFVGGIQAQTGFFSTLTTNPNENRDTKIANIKNAVYLQLNEQTLRTYLLQAKMEFTNNGVTLPLEVPLPNGVIETFNLVESPILATSVATNHPEIKTYSGNGTLDRKSIIRLSLTSSGFNAIILNVNNDAVYFEKSASAASGIYFTYFAKDAVMPQTHVNHSCGGAAHSSLVTPTLQKKNVIGSAGSPNLLISSGNTLTTFRLAMAANAEFVAEHGGTKTTGFNAVVTYVNRIVAFYRNELAVSFTLVNDTNLVYTNPITDPYTNGNQGAMLNENKSNCDAVIGIANYDIGHVWGYEGSSGGGVAAFESVCYDPEKGRGVSGEGDILTYSQVFMDQLVFHEMGHQFGMSHSYNSIIPVCTTREPGTSVEPGSGATIMSYGFTCSDMTGNDDYFSASVGGLVTGPILQFHTANYIQCLTFLGTIQPYPAGVVVVSSTGNLPPVITMPTGHTIPKSTPFVLTGTAMDPNGDPLTYCWEGTNLGGDASNPPTVSTLADPSQAPFSRSYQPTVSGTRIFPVLDSILNGSNYSKGDKLPSVSVAAKYNLTVRDNNASVGGIAYDTVTVTVNGAIGPFLETTNLAASYLGGSSQTITWSVNGTNTATPNVKISLSTDGGYTFPTVLSASTMNDGTEVVTLPNIVTSTARIKVEAIGNIFFDISNFNFAITPAVVCTPTTGTFTASACNSYTWVAKGNQVYTASNTTDTIHLTNVGGCDSLVTLNLTINMGTHNVTTQSACNTYTWNGTAYTTSGTKTFAYNNANGCASVDTLKLTINTGTHNVTTQTACDTYTWNGTAYTTSGTKTFAYNNANGCPSVDTLKLTINMGTHNVSTQTACATYTWNGTAYTTSGTYTFSYSNGNGCPSVDTLKLTINNGTNMTTTQSACTSFTWNGQTYTTSGTYTFSSGCSVDTLKLTINSRTHNVTTQSACNTYTWNGTAYTASGTYTRSYNNANGCPSVDTLKLTINQATTATVFDSICAGGSYTFGSQNLTTSGTFNRTILNSLGCDSTITLNLFVRPIVVVIATASGYNLSATSGFASYQWKLNGNNINGDTTQNHTAIANGSYTVAVTDVYGCTATSTALNVTGVGINDLADKIELDFYPNPASESIIIKTNVEIESILILSMLGQQVKEVLPTNSVLDVADLAAAAYTLQIRTNKGTIVRLFIKK